MPTPARGDTESQAALPQAEEAEPDSLSPAPLPPPPKAPQPLGNGYGGVGDRTKRIPVPPEEVTRVTNLIKLYAPNAPVLVAIAKSESGFDCGIKNAGSSARGCFQILKGTWIDAGCTGNTYIAEDNIKCAKKIFDKSGTSPWNESKNVWGKR